MDHHRQSIQRSTPKQPGKATPIPPRQSLFEATSPLDGIRIASPCTASWDAMMGDERVRHCAHCQKNVYNLSEMSRREAEALVIRTEGRMCVRFYRRSDGTMLTADCPVALRAARWGLAYLVIGSAAVGAILIALNIGFLAGDLRAGLAGPRGGTPRPFAGFLAWFGLGPPTNTTVGMVCPPPMPPDQPPEPDQPDDLPEE